MWIYIFYLTSSTICGRMEAKTKQLRQVLLVAYRKNSYQQIAFDDSYNNLTPREKRFLDKSWAASFAENYFDFINEDRFSVLYSDNPASRPNTPVNVIFGLLIIKEMRGLTDEDAMEELLFSIAVQYALRTTSYEEQPISDRTLSRFRAMCALYLLETGEDLVKEEVKALAKHQAELQGISPRLKRMDSLMVDSSCKKMGRLELLHTVVSNMAKEIIKAGASDQLDDKLRKYAEDEDKNDVCYRLGKDQVDQKMDEIAKDAARIREICEQVLTDLVEQDNKEYRLLVRMLSEQTEEKDGETVLKKGQDISTTSIQNPSDEDATFRNKAGKDHKGYVGNIVETCDENGNVITDFDLKQNIYSDEQFAKDVLEDLGEDSNTEVIAVDGAYVTADTLELAEKNGIQLVAGKLSGQQTNPIIGDFKIDDTSGCITECPQGHKPISSKYDSEKELATAHFSHDDCDGCPYRDQCIGKKQKKSVVVRITKKQVIRAIQAKKMSDEDYKQLINKRNGVEGLPSVLRRKYLVDRIPSRGLVRGKIWFAFKIAAINSKRLVKTLQEA